MTPVYTSRPDERKRISVKEFMGLSDYEAEQYELYCEDVKKRKGFPAALKDGIHTQQKEKP